MPSTKCCVAGCTSRGGHRFPVRHDVKCLWIAAIRRQDWTPSAYSVVCGKHFHRSDYHPETESARNRLKSIAVPSRFPWTEACSLKEDLGSVDNLYSTDTGAFEVKSEQNIFSKTEEDLIDESSESENDFLSSCESESRVKREVEECTDMNYNPCGETSAQVTHSNFSYNHCRHASKGFAGNLSSLISLNFEHSTDVESDEGRNTGTYGMTFDQKLSTNSTEANFMAQSSQRSNNLRNICESESRAASKTKECADINYNPGTETCAQSLNKTGFREKYDDNSVEQSFSQQVALEHSKNPANDSNSELYDNEQLDLLQPYHVKFCSSGASMHEKRKVVKGLSEPENSLSGESESRVASAAKPHCYLNYNLCAGTSFQHLAAVDSCQQLTEENYNTENIEQEHLSGQYTASLDDSRSELLDEEFSDLMQQCYSKSASDVVTQPTEQATNQPSIGETVKDASKVKGSYRVDASYSRLLNRCSVCGRTFNSKLLLKEHQLRKHASHKQRQLAKLKKSFSIKSDVISCVKHLDPNGDTIYNCDKCVFSSKDIQDLKVHASAAHLLQKPYKCPQCDARFTHQSHVSRHVKSIHEQSKPFECTLCYKKFSESRYLDQHWSSVHCGIKPYACEQCDFTCSVKSNLKQHQKIVHEGLKLFHCGECDYKCSKKSNLTEHVSAVHCNEKPHSCSDCGKAFFRRQHLQLHINAVHKGVKPHACTECESRFSQTCHLNRHIRVVHRKI